MSLKVATWFLFLEDTPHTTLLFKNSNLIATIITRIIILQSANDRFVENAFFDRESGRDEVNEPPNRPWQSHVFQGRSIPVHPLRCVPPAANRPGRAQEMGWRWKINLVMQYQPLAVGRDNGVTALRHDTPINVSQVSRMKLWPVRLESVSAHNTSTV